MKPSWIEILPRVLEVLIYALDLIEHLRKYMN